MNNYNNYNNFNNTLANLNATANTNTNSIAKQYLSEEYDNLLNNVTNDNLINLANSIDPLSLNGTNLTDNLNYNYITQKSEDNSNLIKSLTKEIINNLKENKTTVYDNTSINSNINPINKENFNNIIENDNIDTEIDMDSKKSKLKKKKKNTNASTYTNTNTVETETGSNNTNYYKWFIDDCFNYKDFLVLFILYFVLSQEMIKDFFAKYFTCINPGDDDKVGVQGVIVYGLILTVLFMIVRKLF